MRRDASELAHRLAREAEAVCRHYLSNGKREGRYWLVGDVYNTPGRSMFVRLQNSQKGPAGKWTDAATGEHGDLLDIIRHSLGLRDFREVAEEAGRFLKLPRSEPEVVLKAARPVAPAGSQESARRLFAISSPIVDTIVETYLQRRGIANVHHGGSLRFHPRCYHRPDEHLPIETWPAMIACVTDLAGRITGVHRTWLDPDGFDRIRLGKAPIGTPRRAMGDLLGNAVRFGARDDDVLVAGEGIETMLSLRYALPTLPMAAALSANHLSAMLLSSSLRRLYIARDADAAGDMVQAILLNRAQAAGIEAIPLSPRLGDFNEDLQIFGLDALRAALRLQLVPTEPKATKPFLIGHSLGGTLAAAFSACEPRAVRGLLLLGAPICFQPATNRFRDALVSMIPPDLSETDIIPGSLLSHASAFASPDTFVWSRLMDAAMSIGDLRALDVHARVERWALDEAPLPGRLIHQIAEWLYRENRFCRGALTVLGRTIGPSCLDLPTLAVVNTADEVAPLASIEPLLAALPTNDVSLIKYPGEMGVALQHLGILVGREAYARVWPNIIAWLAAHR